MEPRAVGQRVLVATGHVHAQARDAVQPDIDGNQVHHQEARDQPRAFVLGSARPARESLGTKRVHAQREEHECQGDRIHQVTDIDDPAGDALKARPTPPKAHELANPRTNQVGQETAANHVEGATDDGRENETDDLAIGSCAHIEPDRDVHATKQQRREIAGEHRPPIKAAQEGNADRQGQGEQQGDAEKTPTGEEFAEHE